MQTEYDRIAARMMLSLDKKAIGELINGRQINPTPAGPLPPRGK